VEKTAQTALGNRRSDFHFSHSFNNNKLDDRNHFLQNAKTSASLRRLITNPNADHDQPGTLIIFIGIRSKSSVAVEAVSVDAVCRLVYRRLVECKAQSEASGPYPYSHFCAQRFQAEPDRSIINRSDYDGVLIDEPHIFSSYPLKLIATCHSIAQAILRVTGYT